MITMLAEVFTVLSTIWRQNTTGCAMTAIAVVMAIIVVTFAGRGKERERDPGNMTVEELEQKMIDEAW